MRNRTKANYIWLGMAFGVLALPGAVHGAQQSSSNGLTHFVDSNTDRIPALTAFPKYPRIARRDRIEGAATVCFKIKADGRISRPRVTDVQSSYFFPAFAARDSQIDV